MTWQRMIGALLTVAVVATGCGNGDSATTTTSAMASTAATTTSSSAPVELTTSSEASQPSREEIRFQSDGFELVGDLHLPGGEGLFGGLILVPGSGGQTRDGAPSAGLIGSVSWMPGTPCFPGTSRGAGNPEAS